MPVVSSALERFALLRLNQAPNVFFDILGTCALQSVLAALRLGVFETLRNGSLTAPEVARQLDANERGVTALLDLLVPTGYLRAKGDRYELTRATKKWLLAESSHSMAAGLEYWSMLLFDYWSDLAPSIRAGGPPVDFYHDWLDREPGRWQAFQDFMITGAKAMAHEIVSRVALAPSARRLLDIGGGHGLYSDAFCRHHPRLSATVFDLPGAVEVARVGGRVSFLAGDLWVDDFGTGYDVVLLFNLVHTHHPDANRELLAKVTAALNPGGQVLVLEQLAGAAPPGSFGKTFARAAALNFFHLVGGRGYDAAEIAGWLTEAGFADVRTTKLRSLPGNGVVSGRLKMEH